MKTFLIGLLVVGGGVVLAVAGLLLLRAIWPVRILGDTNEIGDDFITVLGTAYGVLVAFVVSSVWNQFTTSEREANAEINNIFTLMHLVDLLPAPTGPAFHALLLQYAHSMAEDEWDRLAAGEGSEDTRVYLDRLWSEFRAIHDGTEAQGLLISEILQRLELLTDSRRLRLFNSDDAVPTVLWALLALEGVITVAFTYLLVAPSLLIQAVMTAALAATVAAALYLIAALNHPFAGSPRVTAGNLRSQIDAWERLAHTAQ